MSAAVKQWLTTERDDGVHVVPLDDLIVHDFADDCACGLGCEFVEPNGWMFVHNSLDNREAVEA